MKKLIFYIVISMTIQVSYSQQPITVIESIQRPKLIVADQLQVSDSTMILDGNVKLEVGDQLQIEADHITFNRSTKLLTAEKIKTIKFTGTFIFSGTSTGRCRYTVGDENLYFE